ncbi:hypothetical protein PENTCL1PPCAC_28562, partial [Pristionchus entomophagus]
SVIVLESKRNSPEFVEPPNTIHKKSAKTSWNLPITLVPTGLLRIECDGASKKAVVVFNDDVNLVGKIQLEEVEKGLIKKYVDEMIKDGKKFPYEAVTFLA